MVSPNSVAVIVVCHPAYAKYAADCLNAIDFQSLKFARKIFVWDAGHKDSGTAKNFPLLQRDWLGCTCVGANPNKARNMGLSQVFDCEWVVFWDVDNVMAADYHAKAYGHLASAPASIAVCYPDIHNVSENGSKGHLHKMPEWSLRAAQSRSLCDSGSFWRVEAVCEAGGWDMDQVRHDDYTLALRIFRAGWKGLKIPATINHLCHSSNRSSAKNITQSLWMAYHFAFVTLWGGGNLKAQIELLKWYVDADIPPFSVLYWLDNSNGRMRPHLNYYAAFLRDKFIAVTVIDGGAPYKMKEGEPYKSPARHKHVAYLYNRVLPMIREEIVVTIEDDTRPPANGVRKLLELIQPGSSVAVASGVYRSRQSPSRICAARNKEKWSDVPIYDNLPSSPFEVGMTGFGFALIANWALQECLPVFCELTPDGRLQGWDGNLGMALTARNYKLLVDPRVKCAHLCPPVLEWEQANPKPEPCLESECCS